MHLFCLSPTALISSYPFINATADPYYIPCYFHTTLGAYITTFAFPGVDGIFIVACLHIASQFWLLSQKLQNVFSHISPSTYWKSRVEKELIECVQYQLKLFDIVDDFVNAFDVITLIHFISTATVIGLASINLLTVFILICFRSSWNLTIDFNP